MSTLTTTGQSVAARESFGPTGSGLSFVGLLRSESIKLWSLRSTYWSFGLVIVASLGIALVLAASMLSQGANLDSNGAQLFVFVATAGLVLGQLIVAVLGVLAVSGEYSSGMIKSTLTAVPNRLPALWAKAIVLFVFTFVVGLVSVVGSFLIAAAILGTSDLVSSFGDALLPLLGNALFLALIAVFSVGIGTILRSSAAGIATSLGIILLLPTVVGLFSLAIDWVTEIVPFLFTSAGSNMVSPGSMESGPASLVVLGWVAVSLGLAALLLKSRDA